MTNPSKPTTRPRKPPIPSVDPFSEHAAVPDWVRAKHPAYAQHSHATGPVTSTRTIQVGGHDIEVRTTYEVRLDGETLSLNLMVDSDGRLWTHLCPYVTFATAPELVEYILERAPEALIGLTPAAHGGGHAHPPHSHSERRRS